MTNVAFNTTATAVNPRQNGNGTVNPRAKKVHRSRRRQFTHTGERAAVLRAFLAAKAYAAGWFNTLEAAAVAAGANIHYIRAALTLLKAGNDNLIHHVLRDHVSILSAAAQVEPQVRLIEALQKASPENLKAVHAATGMTSDLGEHILHSSVRSGSQRLARQALT
jgi:hypothetical protein